MRCFALLAAAGLAAAIAVTAPPASAAAPVRLLTGETPESSVFPADRFTVADAAQLTGRRVALPVPACTPDMRSTCDALGLLNTLDGFDLQPRVFLPFSGDIDVRSVTPATVYVEGAGTRIGLQQLTYDPAVDLLAGTTREQLQEQTRYELVVTRAVRDMAGQPLEREVRSPFTTMSASTELDRLRRALDDGSAYAQAGIASRGASFQQGGVTTVFPPAFAELITRRDQRSADPAAPLVSEPVPNLAVTGTGCFAFGSIDSIAVRPSRLDDPADALGRHAARVRRTADRLRADGAGRAGSRRWLADGGLRTRFHPQLLRPVRHQRPQRRRRHRDDRYRPARSRLRSGELGVGRSARRRHHLPVVRPGP